MPLPGPICFSLRRFTLGLGRGFDRFREVAFVHINHVFDFHSRNGAELTDELETTAVDAGDSDHNFVSWAFCSKDTFARHEGHGGTGGERGTDELPA